jgi:hypothetical protein
MMVGCVGCGEQRLDLFEGVGVLNLRRQIRILRFAWAREVPPTFALGSGMSCGAIEMVAEANLT